MNTFQELLGVLEKRGLKLVWAGEKPAVEGPTELQTPALIEALKAYRDDVIEHLGPVPQVEAASIVEVPTTIQVRWNTGLVEIKQTVNFPIGAWWYRRTGATEWNGIPGTAGERLPARAGCYTLSEIEAVMGPFSPRLGASA